jgi:Flp pilus assembly protein TadD
MVFGAEIKLKSKIPDNHAMSFRFLVFVLATLSFQAGQAPAQKVVPQPLTMGQVLVWMDYGDESRRVAQLIDRQGIDFMPATEFLESFGRLHAKPYLLEKLKGARPQSPSADPARERSAYAHLLACLQNARKETPSSADKDCVAAESEEPSTARFALGNLALLSKQFYDAQGFFKEAVQAAPLIPENHNYLGLAFRYAGDLKAAEVEFREAMRLDAEYETPVSNLASVFLDQNDPETAERYARQAISMPLASAMAHHNLGVALIKQKKAREGIAELFVAERLEPEVPFRHTQIAEILAIGHNYEGALQEYRQAAQLDPSNVHTHAKVLEMLLLLGRKDEAMSECKTLNTLLPNRDGKSCKDLWQSTHRK